VPLFEYVCQSCSRQFEALVLGPGAVTCPSCQSERLERVLSVFAVGGDGSATDPREAPPACHTCGDPRGPGSCRN
jgi:putative FmdB family regulatory protein